ncbi:MAG: PEP-CTERM sorting domain-containing protein [Phycisphaerales bacterium]|nr:PEP-CTERM sorting domain-containing protein [Phycisphaerales bacterium]
MKKVTTIIALVGCSAVAAAQPSSFLDLGVIGNEGSYTFDSQGSNLEFTGERIDTELGLWDSTGLLLASNNNISSSNTWSRVTESLTAGVYFIGVSEFNSVFEDNFINTGSAFEPGDIGSVWLNINGMFANSIFSGDFSLLDQETGFFKVTVIPAPSAMALLGLGGIAVGRRRR